MPRIAYLPFKEGSNKYIGRMQENLAEFGSVCAFPGFKPLLRSHRCRSIRHYDAVVLNWSENDILNPATKRISTKALLKVFLQAVAFRAFSRRLIFVRHNVYAHSTAPKSRGAARRWMNLYEKLFDRVLTHSDAERSSARHYCPHPLYRAVSLEPDVAATYKLPSRYFVMFGQIARYKKIREVMLAMPQGLNLVVIGSVLDQAYHAELADLALPNVFYRPGFISEGAAQTIMAGADAAIVAHADADMVVSGSFFYAVSFQTPVIAVETPFLQWAAAELGSDVVCLAASLDALPKKIEAFARREVMTDAWKGVQRAFGDDAIQRSLAAALRLEGGCSGKS